MKKKGRDEVDLWGFHPPGAFSGGKTPKVLVLGAGMAGLVAARILHDSGFSVQVLEARSRLGGRIWTTWDLGGPLDMGASWIHGLKGNPLTRWCNQRGIPIRRFPRGGTRFPENGRPESLSRIAWKGRRGLLRCLIRGLALYALAQSKRSRPQKERPHLSNLFDPLLKDPLLPPLDRQILLWFRRLEEAINGAPAEKIALSEVEIPSHWPAHGIPLQGFGALITDAAQRLQIVWECPARKIVLDKGSVHVKTTKGLFHGDLAIVTFPVGVLRSNDLEFDPPLPPGKRRAMDSIGYGEDAVLNKIALRFAESACPTSWERLGRLSEPSGGTVSFALWTNMHPVLEVPILVGYTAGGGAAAMDRHTSDHDLVSEALGILGRMFHRDLPEHTAWLVSRWLSDPWSRGSYSFETGESTPQDRVELFRPIGHRIYFAGEAAHPKHYGTVHGALLSGEQAAAAVHKRYCCKSKHTPAAPWHR
jgi:monoamine oxidase